MPSRIWVVDDDEPRRRLLSLVLTREGYAVDAFTDGRAVMSGLGAAGPDMLLVDAEATSEGGAALTRAVRERPACDRLPIVMIAGGPDLADRYEAFQAGADACLARPFDSMELVLNVRALLRLAARDDAEPRRLALGDLTLEPARYLASVAGTPVPLTKMETAVLQVMMRRPGEVFSAGALAEAIRGGAHTPDAVHAHVRNLRAKLEADPRHPTLIVTQGKRGYCVPADPSPGSP